MRIAAKMARVREIVTVLVDNSYWRFVGFVALIYTLGIGILIFNVVRDFLAAGVQETTVDDPSLQLIAWIFLLLPIGIVLCIAPYLLAFLSVCTLEGKELHSIQGHILLIRRILYSLQKNTLLFAGLCWLYSRPFLTEHWRTTWRDVGWGIMFWIWIIAMIAMGFRHIIRARSEMECRSAAEGISALP